MMGSAKRRGLCSLLLVYGLTSLVHFIHNAELIRDYPGSPASSLRPDNRVFFVFSCFRACLSVDGERDELRGGSHRTDGDDDELLPSREVRHWDAALVGGQLELGHDVAGLLVVSPEHRAA